MTRKRLSVREVAKEAKLDLEEALVLLWDAGFEEINTPEDLITNTNHARRILGLATKRELKLPSYWMNLFRLNERGFNELLVELGVKVGKTARTLPKKAPTRLKAEARKRGIDPISGDSKFLVKSEESLAKNKSPFEWITPGHAFSEIRLLKEEEVEKIHIALVEDFAKSTDPIDPPGIKSKDLFASAIFRPSTSNGGIQKYCTIETSAAALLHALIHNHPFHNGNKRTALVSMLVFLDENGFMLTCPENTLFKLVLQVAQHSLIDIGLDNKSDREVLTIANWICKWIRSIDISDYPLTWQKLRRILVHYNCEIEGPKGNRLNIVRKIPYFFSLGTTTLRFQAPYGNEGREVDKNLIKKLRKALHLDELHGIDSQSFYNKTPTYPYDFITKYSKILRRLARL